ncbi:translation initiation factor IF-2-like [Prionailurus viverrinus]|uniref:translation initiation factor IF-2-like n=1 Tax=Prionailurus viverrinus TaxID=61388 RepID=UPI001FF31E64|nr:translation initiation factor IF-2-like [Prionailurus viverrinus]
MIHLCLAHLLQGNLLPPLPSRSSSRAVSCALAFKEKREQVGTELLTESSSPCSFPNLAVLLRGGWRHSASTWCGARRRLWRPGAGPGDSGGAERTVRPPPATRGGGERKEGRTDGPAGRTSSPRGPSRPLTTSLPAAFAAAASSPAARRAPLGPRDGSAPRPPTPSRGSEAVAASRSLPRTGGGTALAPGSPRLLPRPPQPAPPPRSAHAGGADPGSSAFSSASGRWRRRQRRASGRPGRRCSAERELEAGGGLGEAGFCVSDRHVDSFCGIELTAVSSAQHFNSNKQMPPLLERFGIYEREILLPKGTN